MDVPNILNKLIAKEDLTSDEAQGIMKSIMSGELTDAQVSAILIALQSKGVTSDELAAFVTTIRELAVKINPSNRPVIDTCGTGGDGSNTFNISTVAAIVACASGVNVAKHGNRSVSSKCGSADVLEALGVNLSLSPEQVQECIEKVGIGFLFAPQHHPAFKYVGPIRKELGIRTVFNMLGPLLNPADAEAQVIGVFDPALTELYAETLKKLGKKNAMIVHGSGLDEITLCGSTKITQLKDGTIETTEITPEDAGLTACSKDDIAGGDPEESAKIAAEILEGKASPKRDIVALNAAAALVVAGKASDIKEGVIIAIETLESGKAKEKLEELKNVSNDLAKNS